MSVIHRKSRCQYAGTPDLTHIHLIILNVVTIHRYQSMMRHDTRQLTDIHPKNN
jgi:hypothetical protein